MYNLKTNYFPFVVNLVALVKDISDTDDVSIEVSTSLLTEIHAGVSDYYHGMAKNINPIMLDKVKAQLIAQSNITAYMTYKTALAGGASNLEEVLPNEATVALITINTRNNNDLAVIDAKVLSAKRALGLE